MSVIIAHRGVIIAQNFMTQYPSGEPAWKPGVEIPSGSVVGLQWNGSINNFIAFCSWLNHMTDPRNKREGFWVDLVIPFVPCSRQDKPGPVDGDQSEGIDFILSMLHVHALMGHLRSITVVDNHSRGALSKFNNDANWLIHEGKSFINHVQLSDIIDPATFSHIDLIVAPDKGASLRAVKVMIALRPHAPALRLCKKERDQTTGRLKSLSINDGGYPLSFEPQNILVVDDIVEFGGTFCLVSEAIREKWPDAKRHLLVTHGPLGGYTYDTDELPLFVSLYDSVTITDSCWSAGALVGTLLRTTVKLIPIMERLTLERSLNNAS